MQVTASRKWAGEDISYFQMYIYIYIYIHSYLNSLKHKSSIHFLEEKKFYDLSENLSDHTFLI